MYTTYHFTSAEEINADILDSIKTAFKSKAITITVEEDDSELTAEMKAILDERLQEDEGTYITKDELLDGLSKKYGL